MMTMIVPNQVEGPKPNFKCLAIFIFLNTSLGESILNPRLKVGMRGVEFQILFGPKTKMDNLDTIFC
jgi:hypothetical protein